MQKYVGLFVLLVSLLVTGVIAGQQDGGPVTLRESAPDPNLVTMTEIASGFNRPLYLTHAGDDTQRLFIVEQGGLIKILVDGQALPEPFLDVSQLLTWDVAAGGYTERGLLGLAFHPDYSENGLFFINYTDRDGSSVVARYRVSQDSIHQADPDSAETLLRVQQPFANHNGGHMTFGPDGFLYISLGDGGSAGDPQNNGQNPNTLLGTILRIDVDSGDLYGIPESNPFVNGGGAPEVWAWGLRNVWRFSFDRATDDMYLADVGQNEWEEVNFEPADSEGGRNYGWRIYEGTHPYSGAAAPEDMVLPVLEYQHGGGNGCSVTGGYVYRGDAIPDLQGAYLYGDYCSGRMWAGYRDLDGIWQSNVFMDTGLTLSSFGEDQDGELYVLNYQGNIFRLEPAS